MSDNRRRHHAIRNAIKQRYPTEPKGNAARHLITLAALVSGIVGSKSTNLPALAGKVPDGTKQESRIKKFLRWIKNEQIHAEIYFLPYADALLASLADQRTLLLAMDGSEVGRNCLTLMVSVIYKKRALPIACIVVKGNKGHFPEEAHVQLLEQVHQIVPEGADVIFVGDGEFDGITLQATLDGYAWQYACRTAKNTQLGAEGERFPFHEVGVQPGECLGLPDVTFTLQDYGPVLAIAWWEAGYKEPIYLVTNMELVTEACYWCAKRFRIETFFSDQKSRGFNLHKSHISDPARLARLMIAARLAYFIAMQRLGLINTYPALILAYTSLTLPLGTWLMRGYFASVPTELDDAALVDGCIRVQALLRVILPVSMPGLSAVMVLVFILAWSEYLFALVLTTERRMQVLTVGLGSLLLQYGIDWNQLMAMGVITMAPVAVMFLFLERFLLTGLTAGAVKG